MLLKIEICTYEFEILLILAFALLFLASVKVGLVGISAGDRCEHHHPVAGLSAGEGLVLVLLGGGGEDLDPPVPERLHGALTILELLPGRVQAVRSTVILGSGEHDTVAE